MRIPLTKYGLPQVIIYPAAALALMLGLALIFPGAPWLIPAETAVFLVFAWMLSFFRDPRRDIAADEGTLLSPADGTITDISVAEDSGLGEKALRIGIFLSLFNVHINRAPCGVRIESVRYKRGQFRGAMSPESGRVNESNGVLMTRLAEPRDKLLVRQVSGAIARHIVCAAKAGEEYRQGDAFGMIKFGSRTELYLPLREGAYDTAVKPGDTVRAGLTPLIRYKPQAGAAKDTP